MANVLHRYCTGDQVTSPNYIGPLGIEVNTKIPLLANMAPSNPLTVLENNMFMAPAFFHSAKQTDFLLVTGKGCDDYWTIKRIPWLYTVG